MKIRVTNESGGFHLSFENDYGGMMENPLAHFSDFLSSLQSISNALTNLNNLSYKMDKIEQKLQDLTYRFDTLNNCMSSIQSNSESCAEAAKVFSRMNLGLNGGNHQEGRMDVL